MTTIPANPSRDEGTPRPWKPPVVIGDFCLRCGATLDPGRDFDNHGPSITRLREALDPS